MALPMMRYPGLLAPPQQMQPYPMPAHGGMFAPRPMAPPVPMAPPGNFDPWPTKPGAPPMSGPPASGADRFRSHMRDRFADILAPEVMLPVAAALMTGDNWRESAAGGMMALGQGVVGKRRRNRTVEMLAKEDPQLAEWVESGAIDPKDAFAIFTQERKARANMKDNESYFGNVIKGVGPDGKPAYFQTSNQGNLKQVQLPQGFRPEEDWEKLDLGTHWLIRNTRDGTERTVPKELYKEGFQSTSGVEDAKRAAQRRAEAPKAIATAEQTLSLINRLRDHPGRSAGTGADHWRGNIWSTEAYDFAQMNDQLAGKAFLEAFESLKGGGQITQIEGEKATQAIARLARAQSEDGYLQALKDLEEVVQIGLARAQQGVFVDDAAAPAQSAPGGAPPASSGRMRFDANGNQIP